MGQGRNHQRDGLPQDRGWTPEQAAGLEEREGLIRGPFEVDGQVYKTVKEAAEAHGVAPACVSLRMNRYGWTLREALGLEGRTRRTRGDDHVVYGKTYPSLLAVATAFDLSHGTLRHRVVKLGEDADTAVRRLRGEMPKPKKVGKGETYVAFGGEYPSLVAVSTAFDIPNPSLRHRIKNLGEDIETAIRHFRPYARWGNDENPQGKLAL